MAEAARPDSIDGLFARYGPAYRYWVTLTAMMGTISTVLTATIINVALPDIMGAFGMGQDTAQLLSTGFLAAMTGTMLLNAWLVDAVGQRATYLIAMGVFSAASILGGLATGETLLITARLLQGAAAGILQPLAMQVIFQVFPPERRGSAMGVYGIGVVLAPALGPTLGGLLVDSFSWRYVFFIALPFSLLGPFLALLFMPGRTHDGPIRRFDWLGFALLTVFLVTLLDGLSSGQREGWRSDAILVEFSVAIVSVVAFVVWEFRTATPLLNLGLFSRRVFSSAAVVAFIFGAGIYGSTYLIPLFVQTIQGYTPTRSGLLLMPAGFVLALVFPLAGRATDRTPPPLTMSLGLALFALSCFLMTAADTDTPFWTFAGWIVVGRIGLGLVLPSLNAGALAALPQTLLGQGSGAINFVRQLGGAFGVNGLSLLLSDSTQRYAQAFTAAQDGSHTGTTAFLQASTSLLAQSGLAAPERQAVAGRYLDQVIAVQSQMMGFRESFLSVALLFLAALLPTLLMAGAARRRAAAAR
ncbi:DHA2 family efflux MFS transporter permease subunit [Modicisalibacter tunisiensis]|uniref:DHA2 family efflux MFS transporter permease subunit n=1 Tax=Modicisalibacter tunisiensis TaxID=390637 RepID=A0ABS7WWG8_9GAMM|nr:DHA2 family efflux MFS transporter permease subunit [Modicisalibacter tunisiensis]MBZ9566953.1 DHA2 family efflux MFS transporter permease subunit [Modicisalibacter tunisiensis]